MTIRNALSLALVAGSLAPVANADFVIEFSATVGGPFNNFAFVDTNFAPLLGDGTRQPVGFTIPNANDGFWRIYSDNPAVDSLGTVGFSGASNRNIRLIIGRPGVLFSPFQDAGVGACVDWTGGVSQGGARVSVQASVFRNLGNLSTNRISRLKVGGILFGTISHNEDGTPPTGVPRDIVEIRAANVGALGVTTALQVFDGQLQNLIVTGTGNFLGNLACVNSASVGTITVPGVYIGSLSTNSGVVNLIDVDQHLGGSFTTNSGSIGEVRVGTATFAGTIGVALTPNGSLRLANATITTGGSANIGNINCTGDIYGTITAGGGISTQVRATGTIAAVDATGQFLAFGLLRASTGSIALVSTGTDLISDVQAPLGTVAAVSVGRDLVSDILARESSNLIDIARDAYGFVTLDKGLSTTGRVRVGRTLQPGARITVNSSAAFPAAVGLAGQVILNSNSLAGSLGGEVRVPQGGRNPDIVLSQANYTTTSAALGGGAVGLVPYQLYRSDSFPQPEGALLLPSFFAQTPVAVALYGPVFDGDGNTTTTKPVEIMLEVPGRGFIVAVSQYFNVAVVGRAVRLTPVGDDQVHFPTGRFRVRPVAGQLRCAGLDASTVDVASFDYFFRLFHDCNGNGIADPEDIAAAQSSGGSIDCNNNGIPDICDIASGRSLDTDLDGRPDECAEGACRVEYNDDGVLNPDDLGDFITDYFTDPAIAGPGGYAVLCPANAYPYDSGYKTAYTATLTGQCNEPFPDNLGDFITDYFLGC